MEMSQIRYILAAAKHLNFTRTALESDLGDPVFHREGRRILLSDFGRSMLPHLQQIVDEAEATQVLAQNFRLLEQVPIRLGVISTIGRIRLARFLAQFEKNNGELELLKTMSRR